MVIKMKLPQTGGCHCGKIRYEVVEEPRLVYTCHCTDCQRITSSAFPSGSPCRRRPFVSRQASRVRSSGCPIADGSTLDLYAWIVLVGFTACHAAAWSASEPGRSTIPLG